MLTLPELLDVLASALMRDVALVPLQKRFRREREAIDAVRNIGITLQALSTELAARGVRDKRGTPLSYGNLRVLISRLDGDDKQPERRTKPMPMPDPQATIQQGTHSSLPTAPQPHFSGLFSQQERLKITKPR